VTNSINQQLHQITSGISVIRSSEATDSDSLLGRVAFYLNEGYRLSLVCAKPLPQTILVTYCLVGKNPDRRHEIQLEVKRERPELPSLAKISFSASRFEREMADLYGIIPLNHPLPKRLVRHGHWPEEWYPMISSQEKPKFESDRQVGYPFQEVAGSGIYEIPVGPIHAGMIEPGHFRFFALGETVIRLRIRLWFLHKGLEKLFVGKTPAEAITLAEKISGDTSFGHSLAMTMAIEDALGITVPTRVASARAILLEAERIYNHIGDIGALANDVGFSWGNAIALDLKEEMMRLNSSLTQSRLLRGTLGVGTVKISDHLDLIGIDRIASKFEELIEILTNHSMVRDRFHGTAILGVAQAKEMGCLGVVARASGIEVDARIDHPFMTIGPTASTLETGDVNSRFLQRVNEIRASVSYIRELARFLRVEEPIAQVSTPPRESGFSLVEGWRGTIAHRVEIKDGIITNAKIVDPSWFNWPSLPIAMTNTIVPDFPLVNKSFNLSYSGNDL
ncbi:unnamed protein product, partial [Acidithrix sp. C25]